MRYCHCMKRQIASLIISQFLQSTFDNPTLPPDRIIPMMKLLYDDCEDQNVRIMRLYVCLLRLVL